MVENSGKDRARSVSKMKKTEIGVIPEDWEVGTIRDISTIFGRIGFRGYTVKDIVGEDQGAISISPSNIKNGKITFSNNTYISWFKYEESPEIKIYNGDILLVKTGSTVGKAALVKDLKQAATLNPQVVVFKKLKINKEFFSYIILDSKIQNQIISNVVGGAIPTLSQELVYSFQIPLPPLPEQEVIATALSDADAWIEHLEQLIAKKRLIKQGAMQELLTPPSHAEPVEAWEVKKLGEVGEIITGGTPSTLNKEFWGSDIPWITPTDININKNIYYGERNITELGLKQIRPLPANTLLVTCIASIGKNAILRVRGACNQQINAVVPNSNFNVEFLYYLLELKKSVLQGKAGVTATPILSKAEFSTIEISFPSLSEQERISTILSDMDAELEALEKQLGKAQQIKQGMMQELLTGRIRLV